MSNYTELYNRCRRRLGRRAMDVSAEFLDEMKAAQERLEEGPALPNFLKTQITSETLAGSSTLTFMPPTGFIRIQDDMGVTWVDADGNTQRATRLDTYDQLRQKIQNGIPAGQIYYFLDRIQGTWYFRINPQTEDFDFTLRYYAKDTVLTGANDNKWTQGPQASLIMAMAGIELALWLRDDRALQYFQGLEMRERARMLRAIEADEWGDMDLVMGDPD